MNNPWDEITPPSKDLSARRVDHTHPLDLFWARDHYGNFLFIYEFYSAATLLPHALPDLSGIQASFLQANDNAGKYQFILLLKEHSKWDIFLSLCNDLVQTTRYTIDSSSSVQVLLRRLSHWQEFLKRVPPDILPEEIIKGLIGELLFIKNHLSPAFGAMQAIKFWQGPEGLPQDFNVNDCAIEVKCQSGSTSPSVRITSVEQLCPQLPEMYLFVVTLGKTTPDNEVAINLPLLVDSLTKELELDGSYNIERFNDLLHMIGYVDSDRYRDFSYILINQKMYQITDSFPRICAKDIHAGIDRVTYYVDLALCEPFKNCPEWMEV